MIDPDANGWLPIETAPKDGTKIDLWARLEGTDIFERVTDCSWQEMADWTGAEYMGWSLDSSPSRLHRPDALAAAS